MESRVQPPATEERPTQQETAEGACGLTEGGNFAADLTKAWGDYAEWLAHRTAEIMLREQANHDADERNWCVAPLYRQPQPTLTDAEREAIADAAGRYVEGITPKAQEYAATLRGLLERLK
jgi:hypothetical protein